MCSAVWVMWLMFSNSKCITLMGNVLTMVNAEGNN